MHRSHLEIRPKMGLVETGSQNEIKVAAMLQLQHQKVVTMHHLF